jgi:predicted SAM-dependent methyltransferase
VKAWLQRVYRPIMGRLLRPPLRPPISLLYRGDRVECPCCGGTFRRFLPAVRPVGPNRPAQRCPGCGARERNRHLWLYLRDKTDFFSDRLRVLHFAPERALEQRLAAQPNLDYVTTDLERARATVKADITALPFSDESFDVILCSHVLEHVVDDRKALRELFRVLKPNGWAVVQVPTSRRLSETYEDSTIVSPRDRERAFGQADHVRIYGRDFAARVREVGFNVRVEDYGRELGEERARRYGLRARKPGVGLHVCEKRE